MNTYNIYNAKDSSEPYLRCVTEEQAYAAIYQMLNDIWIVPKDGIPEWVERNRPSAMKS